MLSAARATVKHCAKLRVLFTDGSVGVRYVGWTPDAGDLAVSWRTCANVASVTVYIRRYRIMGRRAAGWTLTTI